MEIYKCWNLSRDQGVEGSNPFPDQSLSFVFSDSTREKLPIPFGIAAPPLPLRSGQALRKEREERGARRWLCQRGQGLGPPAFSRLPPATPQNWRLLGGCRIDHRPNSRDSIGWETALLGVLTYCFFIGGKV